MAFLSCKEKVEKVKIVYSADEPIVKIAQTMKRVIDQSGTMEAELIIGEGSIANVDSLLSGEADLAIIENHTPVEDGVDAILPIYPQVLHILYMDDHEITDFKEVVEGKTVFMGLKGSGSYRFMENLFQFFEVDRSLVTITDNPFDMNLQVYAAFGDIMKDENLFGLEAFRLFSFDKVTNYKRGSVAEAICLKYPQMKPFIIPRSTYKQLTPNPVLTISVDAVLVGRTNLEQETVYELSKILFQNHQKFNHISPLIYLSLTERFDPNQLNFPLHPGARQYLEKDEPTFFERYAEVIGIVFTIIVTLISGLISLAKWSQQTKKDRIDVFYEKIIQIKNSIPDLQTVGEAVQKIQELQKEQDLAFDMLIDEKLQANESFRIYMELNKEIIQMLRSRMRSLTTEPK